MVAGMGAMWRTFRWSRKPMFSEKAFDAKTHWNLILPARPGYGKSQGASHPDKWSYTDLVEDVKSLVDHLKIAKFAVYGMSFGVRCYIKVGFAVRLTSHVA